MSSSDLWLYVYLRLTPILCRKHCDPHHLKSTWMWSRYPFQHRFSIRVGLELSDEAWFVVFITIASTTFLSSDGHAYIVEWFRGFPWNSLDCLNIIIPLRYHRTLHEPKFRCVRRICRLFRHQNSLSLFSGYHKVKWLCFFLLFLEKVFRNQALSG